MDAIQLLRAVVNKKNGMVIFKLLTISALSYFELASSQATNFEAISTSLLLPQILTSVNTCRNVHHIQVRMNLLKYLNLNQSCGNPSVYELNPLKVNDLNT